METRRTVGVKAEDLLPGDKLWLYGLLIDVEYVMVGAYVALNSTFGLDREKMLRVSVPRPTGPFYSPPTR